MIDIKALNEEAAQLLETATKFANDNAEFTPEQDTEQAARFAKLDAINKRIEAATKLASYKFSRGEVATSQPTNDALANAITPVIEHKIDRAQFGRALSHWALTGEMPARFATITTSTASSALYPKLVGQPATPTVGNQIRQGMQLVGASPIVTDGTAAFNFPVVIPSVGVDLSETAASATENGTDGSAMVNNVPLNPTAIQSGQVWSSNLELSAVDFDLLAAIEPSLDDAKEMRLEQKIFAAVIADSGITQTVTSASSSTITYANLVDLNRKFLTRFDRQKVIYLSTATYALAEKLVDSTGRPILNADAQNQSLLKFNGTPVLKSDYLQNLGTTGNVVGVCISFASFKLRDAGQPKLLRYSNVPTRDDQVGVNKVGYHAFGYLAAGMATLKSAQSLQTTSPRPAPSNVLAVRH